MKVQEPDNFKYQVEKKIIENRDMISTGISSAVGILVANLVTDAYRYAKIKTIDFVYNMKSNKKTNDNNKKPSDNLAMDEE